MRNANQPRHPSGFWRTIVSLVMFFIIVGSALQFVAASYARLSFDPALPRGASWGMLAQMNAEQTALITERTNNLRHQCTIGSLPRAFCEAAREQWCVSVTCTRYTFYPDRHAVMPDQFPHYPYTWHIRSLRWNTSISTPIDTP